MQQMGPFGGRGFCLGPDGPTGAAAAPGETPAPRGGHLPQTRAAAWWPSGWRCWWRCSLEAQLAPRRDARPSLVFPSYWSSLRADGHTSEGMGSPSAMAARC